jgi:hypothetical protein
MDQTPKTAPQFSTQPVAWFKAHLDIFLLVFFVLASAAILAWAEYDSARTASVDDEVQAESGSRCMESNPDCEPPAPQDQEAAGSSFKWARYISPTYEYYFEYPADSYVEEIPDLGYTTTKIRNYEDPLKKEIEFGEFFIDVYASEDTEIELLCYDIKDKSGTKVKGTGAIAYRGIYSSIGEIKESTQALCFESRGLTYLVKVTEPNGQTAIGDRVLSSFGAGASILGTAKTIPNWKEYLAYNDKFTIDLPAGWIAYEPKVDSIDFTTGERDEAYRVNLRNCSGITQGVCIPELGATRISFSSDNLLAKYPDGYIYVEDVELGGHIFKAYTEKGLFNTKYYITEVNGRTYGFRDMQSDSLEVLKTFKVVN